MTTPDTHSAYKEFESWFQQLLHAQPTCWHRDILRYTKEPMRRAYYKNYDGEKLEYKGHDKDFLSAHNPLTP